jgi:hypothetical protein
VKIDLPYEYVPLVGGLWLTGFGLLVLGSAILIGRLNTVEFSQTRSAQGALLLARSLSEHVLWHGTCFLTYLGG